MARLGRTVQAQGGGWRWVAGGLLVVAFLSAFFRASAALGADPTPAAGVAAQVNFLVPLAGVPCSNTAQIIARITDSSGLQVDNGTTATFTTTIGMITPERITNGGNATAIFTAPDKPGQAQITVKVGALSKSVAVSVVCTLPTPTPALVAI